MIDWNRVAELRQEVGEDDFAEVLELFLEEVEEVICRLRVSSDIANLEADMHFLKGSALNLGFKSLSDICRDGERAAAGGRGADFEVCQVLDTYHSSKQVFFEQLAN